jgi:uncharacterized protein (DUF2252 family)
MKRSATLAGPKVTIRRSRDARKDRATDLTDRLQAGLVRPFASIDERIAEGKAARTKVPRDAHAQFKRAADTDPLAILAASDSGRDPELVPIRYGRMMESPFAFFRGSACLMAADLATTVASGKYVQACGDCHLMNFGGFATPERNIVFGLNDFDETLPAPWEWDVKRLATSFVLAARSAGMSDRKGRDFAVTCVRSYRERLADLTRKDPLSVWYSRITADDFLEGLPKSVQKDVRATIERAMKRTPDTDFPKLADMVGGRIGIRDTPPLIFHPPEARSAGFTAFLQQCLDAYRQSLGEDRRHLLDEYKAIDAAIKVVGIGSVGRRCWVLLLMSTSNAPLFLQIKQAVPSVLEPFAGKSSFLHHGQRVVVGQTMMQPASDLFLGWVTGTKGRHFYVRQLRDAKIKPLVETMDALRLNHFAERCGWALAHAHAKATETAGISGYLGKSDHFDEAVGRFALAYADQTERDHATLKAAVRKGKIAVYQAP